MAVIDVSLINESRTRYLTYALSVVSGRALPDVRDGLKPVQRRILYAMMNNLHLEPQRAHRKSAAVVGEVLARYHPHGDMACYDAMVRMAQPFALRYPLIDGQGNFGSLDGDAPAAYRYTEARLTPFAVEVLGDIGEQTVAERDNFDQTVKEPVVLPTRVPHLLVNGASGIAVGMATAIPPHNLNEVIRAIILLLDDAEVSDAKILQTVKGPDFPTGCLILNTPAELKQIYLTGRGPVRMRGEYTTEDRARGKKQVIVTSVPYMVDKSLAVEKIADLIIAKRVPQFVDVRDESTDKVRIVLELATDADAEAGMAFLYRHTPLESNFNVNLNALLPTENPYSSRPSLLTLRAMLEQFIAFRLEVTRSKLLFEKQNLERRIHLLEGLIRIYDVIPEIIRIVRKSSGRADSAARLVERFKLSEEQAFFIVDLRIYQLSKTSIEEIRTELTEKQERVEEIERLLKSVKALKKSIADDLQRIAETFGDPRRSRVISDFEEPEFDSDAYVKEEDVLVMVTRDGWLKRAGSGSDPKNARLRPNDSLFFAEGGSSLDLLAIFTTFGNLFIRKAAELSATSGFGDPVQKLFRFQDGEQIAECLLLKRGTEGAPPLQLCVATRKGLGYRLELDDLSETKKTGRRIVRLGEGDTVTAVTRLHERFLLLVSAAGYSLLISRDEVPILGAPAKGVKLQKLPGNDELVVVQSVAREQLVYVLGKNEARREVRAAELEPTKRALRGLKLVKRGLPVVGRTREVG